MTDPQNLAALVAELRHANAARAEAIKRAEKAEADCAQGQRDYCDLKDRHDAHFSAWQSAKLRAEKAEAALSESQATEEGAMMILTQTFIERDVARKALSESQALLAMLHRAITEASDPDFIWGAMDNVHDMDAGLEEFAKAASRAIRAAVPTPADAQAALDARINAAREEGRIAGLREAAEICNVSYGDGLGRAHGTIIAKIKEAE